jgi:hypothetical protein
MIWSDSMMEINGLLETFFFANKSFLYLVHWRQLVDGTWRTLRASDRKKLDDYKSSVVTYLELKDSNTCKSNRIIKKKTVFRMG